MGASWLSGISDDAAVSKSIRSVTGSNPVTDGFAVRTGRSLQEKKQPTSPPPTYLPYKQKLHQR